MARVCIFYTLRCLLKVAICQSHFFTSFLHFKNCDLPVAFLHFRHSKSYICFSPCFFKKKVNSKNACFPFLSLEKCKITKLQSMGKVIDVPNHQPDLIVYGTVAIGASQRNTLFYPDLCLGRGMFSRQQNKCFEPLRRFQPD